MTLVEEIEDTKNDPDDRAAHWFYRNADRIIAKLKAGESLNACAANSYDPACVNASRKWEAAQ